jgi:Transposase DDE domain
VFKPKDTPMSLSAPALVDIPSLDSLQPSADAGSCEQLNWLRPLLASTQLGEASLNQLARDTGALTRQRCVRSAQQLLYLLMLYVVSDASLRDVAAYSTAMGAPLSDEAVRQRFHLAETFVTKLLSLLFAAELQRPTCRRMLLCDGTTVQGPGAKGTDFRLHTLMELGGTGAVQVELTDNKQSESLLLQDLHKGDFVLADSEFGRVKDIDSLATAGVDVLVRFCNQRWPGQPAQNWLPALSMLPPCGMTTFKDVLPSGKPVYIHVLALPQEQADEARRKKRKSTKKKTGKQPQAITLVLCGYVMVLTTLPPHELSAKQALDWYRRRWQIELLFKRQKSLLGLAELRSGRASALSRVRIWMKLMYSFLVDQGARWDSPIPDKRDRSVWRAWRLAREVLRVQLWLPLLGWRAAEVQVLYALTERPRKRRTQILTGLLEALQGALIA